MSRFKTIIWGFIGGASWGALMMVIEKAFSLPLFITLPFLVAGVIAIGIFIGSLPLEKKK